MCALRIITKFAYKFDDLIQSDKSWNNLSPIKVEREESNTMGFIKLSSAPFECHSISHNFRHRTQSYKWFCVSKLAPIYIHTVVRNSIGGFDGRCHLSNVLGRDKRNVVLFQSAGH